MIKITKIATNKLESIKGGATFTVGTGIIIATVVVFISGLIEGLTNPERCHG